MPNDPIPPAKVREIRDLMLQYMYVSGRSGKPEVPVDEIKEALNLSTEEYLLGYNNLLSRRLLMWPGAAGCIALNLDGQFEVETSVQQLPRRDDAAALTNVEPTDKTDRMVVEFRHQQSLKAMREQTREIQAEFDAYRSRPWWQRIAG